RPPPPGVGTPGTRAGSYIVTAMIVISIIIALAIGIRPILIGLEPGQVMEGADFRWGIYVSTLRAKIEFLPFGSGLSTFAYVFPRFQGYLGTFATDYAHNDYLQAFLELGLMAPIIVGLSFAAYARRMFELLRAEGGRSFT